MWVFLTGREGQRVTISEGYPSAKGHQRSTSLFFTLFFFVCFFLLGVECAREKVHSDVCPGFLITWRARIMPGKKLVSTKCTTTVTLRHVLNQSENHLTQSSSIGSLGNEYKGQIIW